MASILLHLVFLGVVILVSWAFEAFLRNKLNIKRSTTYWVVLIAISVALSIVLAPFIAALIAIPFLSDAAQDMSFTIGGGDYASLAIFAAFLAVAYVAWRSWRKVKSYRPAIFVLALLAVSAFGLSMSLLSGDHRFAEDGAPTQCYVVLNDRVEFRTIRYEGPDPVSGRICRRLVTEQVQAVERLDRHLRAGIAFEALSSPADAWFSPTSGVPVHWFERRVSGELDIYAVPGFSPRTGRALEPISVEVVDEWLRAHAETQAQVRAAEHAEFQRQEEAARRQQADDQHRASQELAEARRLEINEARSWWIPTSSVDASYVQVVDTTEGRCGDVDRALRELLEVRRCSIGLNPLRGQFETSNTIDNLLEGEPGRLSDIPEFNQSDVTFAVMHCNCEDAILDGHRSCELTGQTTAYHAGEMNAANRRLSEHFGGSADRVIALSLPDLFAHSLLEELSCPE